jgi:CheY-like chemotaxis protein
MEFVNAGGHTGLCSAVRSPSVMKILIVDDNRDVADTLAALVRVVLDYDVCVRYSGEAAIEVAGQYRPDVVILDVNMPGLDGLQTAQILKTDRRLGEKTFIAHTATDDLVVRRIASRVGFHQVVAKGDTNAVSELIDLLSELEPTIGVQRHPR